MPNPRCYPKFTPRAGSMRSLPATWPSTQRYRLLRGFATPSLRLTRTLSPRALGRVLRRCEGRSIGGFRLRRLVRDREGTIFMLEMPESGTRTVSRDRC
jgi:hypothetical protein